MTRLPAVSWVSPFSSLSKQPATANPEDFNVWHRGTGIDFFFFFFQGINSVKNCSPGLSSERPTCFPSSSKYHKMVGRRYHYPECHLLLAASVSGQRLGQACLSYLPAVNHLHCVSLWPERVSTSAPGSSSATEQTRMPDSCRVANSGICWWFVGLQGKFACVCPRSQGLFHNPVIHLKTISNCHERKVHSKSLSPTLIWTLEWVGQEVAFL